MKLAARRAACALGSATAACLTTIGTALAASPSPPGQGGDPRSSGQGPGLVGDPLLAVVVVVGIGLGALLITLAYVRLTSGARS